MPGRSRTAAGSACCVHSRAHRYLPFGYSEGADRLQRTRMPFRDNLDLLPARQLSPTMLDRFTLA